MPAAGPAKKRASVKSAAKATAKPAAKPAAQATSHAAATAVVKTAAKPAAKPVKRSQQQASKAEREAKDKQEAQKVLLISAKNELLRFHKDAASDRAAAQQAESKKAAKSYAQAEEARKKNALKAEQELHNKKAQILLETLKQMAEARAGGKADNASQSKKQKVNGTGQGSSKASSKGSVIAPGFDITLCSCGQNKVFCKDPLCFTLYCEDCGLNEDDQQGFESCGHGGSHKCYLQAPGPYCKQHIAKYLSPCEECEVVACDTEPCDGCSSPICQDCLKDGMCEHCRSGWADTCAEYGIESDDDCGEDPFGY